MIKMLKGLAKRGYLAAFLLSLLGASMVPTVWEQAHYRDMQSRFYDIGLVAEKSGLEQLAKQKEWDDSVPADLQTALQAFQQSLVAYKNGLNADYWLRFYFPAPDQELAALAYFHMGNILRKAKQPEKALSAYIESLRLNSGQKLLPGVSARDDQMHQYGREDCVSLTDESAMHRPMSGEACQLIRLGQEANDTRENIVSLVNENPELEKKLQNPNDIKFNDSDVPQKDGKSTLPMPGQGGGHNDEHGI